MESMSILTGVKMYALVFGFVFLLIGIFAYFYFSKRYKIAKETDSWPQVQGEITKSVVKSVKIDRVQYKPAIEYKYTVNGSNYSNNWVNVGNLFKERKGTKEANEIVSQFPAGSTVTVYHDPRSPHISVLIPGLLPIHTTLRTVSILIILVDVFILLLVGAMFVLGI